MEDVMYYHGTKNDSADIIVKTQMMEPSVGDDHWLGDGYYFYYEEEYAFRWILLKYTQNFTNEFSEDYDGIYNQYTIVSAEIDIKPNRLFDLTIIENAIFFQEVKNLLEERVKISEKYKNKSIVDGVVFNYIFKYTDHKKNYDAVTAVFPIIYINSNSRIDFLPEKQLCVKNSSIISNYKIYSLNVVPQNYKIFIKKYNNIKGTMKKRRRNSNRYKTSRNSIKYKKEGLI